LAIANTFNSRRRQEEKYRINGAIRNVNRVRLVGDNVEQGIYTLEHALQVADELLLDLVEISPSSDPPVCKVVDYRKFLYQQKKKEKETKANAVKVVVKEIRFGPQTDEHDYNFKLKHAINFIAEGNHVKASVFFRGRAIMFKDQGEVLLKRFTNDLSEIAKVDVAPKLEGKRMIINLSPKNKK
jgi:translation initiation factor IF-3